MSKTVSFITKNFGKYDVSSIGSYMECGGFDALKKAITLSGEEIAEIVAAAKIKGRGGAGYDMGRKLAQAKSVIAEKKVVICNADEGEPCTFKDRTLLENDPFNLIESMIITGYTVDAEDGYIYLREEYGHLRPLLLNAIRQAKTYGFLGTNILGKGFNFEIHLYSGAGAYVCGEGTALIESIEGKSGRPRMKPPFIKQCGLYNRPTCVNNVESLSLLSHILLDENKEYQTYGMGDSIGTKLISVAGNVRNPGVFEIPFGTTVREIVYDLAGGIDGDRPIRLLQFGGASGKIASSKILDTPYTYEDLKRSGVTVGSGAILVIDDRTSLIEFLQSTQEFFSHESCGQCTPCREGNRHIKLFLQKLADGTHTEKDITSMKKIAKLMAMSSLCGLGETAQSALVSAMNQFEDVFHVKSSEVQG